MNLPTLYRAINSRRWKWLTSDSTNNAFKFYTTRRRAKESARISSRLPWGEVNGLSATTASLSSFTGLPNFHFLHNRIYTTSTIHHNHSQFPKEHYPPYKRAVATILSHKEFKSRKASLIAQGLWNENMFQKFEWWLLQPRPSIDEQVTQEHWSDLSRKWTDEFASSKSSKRRVKKSNGKKDRSSCSSQFASQREALQSSIFATSSLDQHQSKRDDNLRSQSFSRMLQFVFHKLVDQCLEGANSRVPILPAVWYKMKESGVIVQRSKLRTLLNASTTSNAIEQHMQQQQSAARKELVLEDLVVYHDLLSGDSTGETFYQRYPAMLKHYCEKGDAGAALSLLRQLRTLPKSPFKYDHYVLVLTTLAEKGYFRNGAQLFDEIAKDLATKAWEITPSSALRLHIALTKEFETLCPPTNENSESMSTLKGRQWGNIPVRDTPMETNEFLACRVQVDPSWICPVTKTQLRCDSFAQSKRKQMEEHLLAIVQKQSTLATELQKFTQWLNNRIGPPFTVFLDGANMGSSIEPMMANLKANGHTSLAIFPEKTIVTRSRSLKEWGKIYVVSDDSYDDLFCMIATVTDQIESSSNHPLPAEEPVVLMTNDLFRDHEQELGDPLLVRQWRRYHCRRHCSWDGKSRPRPPAPNKRASWKDVNQLFSNAGLGGIVQKISEELDERPEGNYDDQSNTDSLTPHQRKHVYDDILALAQRKSTAYDEMKRFCDWLDHRKGHPFTVILDGANVGSLESMVATLEAKGEYPLVVCPEKFSTLNPSSMSATYRLRNSGKIYVVPDCHDDDLYCMIATVSDQTTPCSRHLTPRAPGVRPILITNDRFLDHKKKMKDSALFCQWYSHHCYKHNSRGSLMQLPTDIFSRRIERNELPHNDEADGAYDRGDKVWHFPVSGWGFQDRFVIRLPKQSKCSITQNK